MSKGKAFAVMLVLLFAMALSAAMLWGYVGSGGWSGVTFSEEAARHGGLYLEGDHIFASDIPTISVSGTTATITGGGKYELSGILNDGQIIVDAGDEDEVTLELDDASIHCSNSAPIWVKNAGKVKIKLPEETVNSLSDGESYDYPDNDSQPNACITSACDLTVKGKGSLTVTGNFRNGISTSDDLKIRNGLITVTAPRHALRGRDSVELSGGTITLTAGENAIDTLGTITAETCTVTLTAQRYGLKAVTGVTLRDTAAIFLEAPLPVGCLGEILGQERILPIENAPSTILK